MSRVALIGENSIGYINALIDIWNNGDCAVLLDWRIPFKTALEMMAEADVHTCFVEKTLFNKIEVDLLDSISFITYDKHNVAAEQLPKFVYDKFQDNYSKEEAVVIYSSGTTGKAKGIILSHFAINTNADAIIDYMNPTPEDCIYIAKSLSHSSTLTGELLVALKTKMRLIIAPTIVSPRCILNNINKYSVTIICLNPTLLSLLADEYQRNQYNLFSLKSIYVSGSILGDQIYNKTHTIFSNIPIYNVYGLSEAGPRVTAQRIDCCKSNSVGKPIKGVEIAIFDEHGNLVHNSEYGILHVKTLSAFNGYITGNQKHISLREGWHNTGDVAYIDINGEIHIVDRIDDVIIIDSHKIYPSCVEKQINSVLDNIEDCYVFEVIDNSISKLICLYVRNTDLNMSEINKLHRVLLPYEKPRMFLRCDAIPRNKNQKRSLEKSKKLALCIIEGKG